MAKILIVDDSGFSRRTLRKMLEADSHSVVEAEDGLAALERSLATAAFGREVAEPVPPMFVPFQLRGMSLRNRIVMSSRVCPVHVMCRVACHGRWQGSIQPSSPPTGGCASTRRLRMVLPGRAIGR